MQYKEKLSRRLLRPWSPRSIGKSLRLRENQTQQGLGALIQGLDRPITLQFSIFRHRSVVGVPEADIHKLSPKSLLHNNRKQLVVITPSAVAKQALGQQNQPKITKNEKYPIRPSPGVKSAIFSQTGRNLLPGHQLPQILSPELINLRRKVHGLLLGPDPKLAENAAPPSKDPYKRLRFSIYSAWRSWSPFSPS